MNWFPEFYTKDFDMGSKPVLFSYTDGVDKLLLLFGTLGSIGDGLMTPLFFFLAKWNFIKQQKQYKRNL